MKKKTVLLIYRNHGFMYKRNYMTFVNSVKKLGIGVIVLTDCIEKMDDHEIEMVEHVHECMLSDIAEARKVITKVVKDFDVFRIFAFTEWDVYLASLCRADNNIYGMKPEEGIYFRDKYSMHVKASEIGVKIPEFCNPYTLDEIKRFVSNVEFPIIIKPYDGAGSVNTYPIYSENELVKVWNLICNDRRKYKS